MILLQVSFLVVSQFNSAWVPENDITTILMADYGLQLYGNAVIVNTDFAKDNPDMVKKFVVALGAGWKDAINDPKAAIAALVKRNPAADSALEQRHGAGNKG